MIIKTKAFAVTIFSLILIGSCLLSGYANALSFQSNRIIDDSVFNNFSTMTAADVNNFLNQSPSSCISTNNGFSAPDPTGYSPTGGFTYGGNASGGQVIYDASRAYGLNPQVLLVTLQKEQSLVTGGAGCSTLAYSAATGYGCLDSGGTYNYSNVDLYTINGNTVTSVNGTCVDKAAAVGFSQQVIRTAWLLEFGEQRSEGNISWDVQLNNVPEAGDSWNNSDDPQSCYSGPMTQGTWDRCPNDGGAYYDGYTTIDGTSVHMDNGATASLYWYTPHFSGNENFFNIFLSWFGSPYSGQCESPVSAPNTDVIFNNPGGNTPAIGNFMIYDGSSTGCVEFHAWSPGFTSWLSHNASNLPSINTADSEIAFADLNGNGQDVPILVDYANTGSGMVEFHIWDSDLQTWSQHIISNAPEINPSVSKIEFADLYGNGKDEAILIGEGNGSTSTGNIEFHVWSSNFQSFTQNIVSNSTTMDPTVSKITFADLNGNGKDVGILISLHPPTGSGNIEFHVWNPGFQSWNEQIISNQPVSS